MKNFYFPAWWDVHNGRLSRTGVNKPLQKDQYFASGRALFGDWGRLGCVYVDENLHSFSQFNLNNPLSYDGQEFTCLKQDDQKLNENNPHAFLTTRIDYLNHYHYINANISHFGKPMKKRHEKQMKDFIELQKNNGSLSKLQQLSSFIPPFLKHLVEQKNHFLSEEIAHQTTLLSSPIYSGGCIKSFEFNRETYLIYSDGIHLSQLTINRFDLSDCSLHSTAIYRFGVDETENYGSIFQIDIVSHRDDLAIIAVRLINSLVTLKLFCEESEMKLEKINEFQSLQQVIYGKINRVDHKNVFGTFSDQLNVYDAEVNENVWSKQITNYSTVIDHWNEIQSINHRSLCVITNRSSCTLHDIRVSPLKPGLELFSLSPLLQSSSINSRVDSSFYHGSDLFDQSQHSLYLFTAANARQIDIRSPQLTTSHWLVPLLSPVSFSSISSINSPLSSSSSINIAAGSQLCATHAVWNQHRLTGTDNYSKSTAIVSKSESDNQSIMSLGLTMHLDNHSNRLFVFTIDNHGNVFGNRYRLNDNCDKYECYSATPSESATYYDRPIIDPMFPSGENNSPVESSQFSLSDYRLSNKRSAKTASDSDIIARMHKYVHKK